MNELIGPNLIPQILDAGYNFDFIDDAAIARGGIPYRILCCPESSEFRFRPFALSRNILRPAEWLSRRDASRRSPRG